jgi:hypothetical protein
VRREQRHHAERLRDVRDPLAERALAEDAK